MGLRVGVVCEGSYDFNVLYHIIDKIIREYGETVGAIECLQPEVSATFQVGGGGWTQVRSWCLSNNGQGYRKYFDKPIFSTSKAYDIIVVHLDGDVAGHCEAPPLTSLNIDVMTSSDTVFAIKYAVLNHWLSLERFPFIPVHSRMI